MTKNKTELLKSLQFKISSILLLCTTIVLLFILTYQTSQIRFEFDTQLTSTNKNTAIRLSKHIELPMWQVDKELVTASIESEFLNNDIYAIIISDEAGSTFTGLVRDAQWKTSSVKSLSDLLTPNLVNDFVSASRPISHKSQPIGQLTVYSTKQFNEQRIQQEYITQATLTTTTALLLIIVTFIVVRMSVIKRVNMLSNVALEMSKGKFNGTLSTVPDDELGKLSHSMNMLNKSYHIARKQLKSV